MDRNSLLGYLYGVLAAGCFATSSILIRKGLDGLPSSLWGLTVGLVTATCIQLAWLAFRQRKGNNRKQAWRGMELPIKRALGFYALAGMTAAVGMVGRVVSIELAPVVVAMPLGQTTSLFTLIFAPLLLGRHLERVTYRLVIGAVCVVAGSALVIIGQYA